MRKRERAADEEEKAPKSPRPTVGGKSLASMGLQGVVVAPLSDSSSSSSDSDDDSGRCHHLTLDSDAVEMAVLDLSISEVPPTCHEPRCGVTWKGAGYDKEGMTQCLECHYIGCTRGLDREDPRGHALAHAASSKHYVAQWYDVPNLGFCFKCVRVMRLSDSPALNQEECSEEDRKIKEQRAMVASKTLPAGKSKDDWGTTASSPRVDWPTAASTPSPRVDWPTAASTPSPRVDWPTVASTPMVDWSTVASSSKVDLGNVARNILDQWGMGAGNDMAESAIGNGYIIRGMPNYGNTCYMNASLQCLLALGKLRTIILGPDASDARLGTMGLELKWLFQETSSVNNARRMLDPQTILGCMQSLYQDRFEVGKMEDSHEFLTLFHTGLDNEVEELNRSHVLEGGGVFPTFGHSIFSSQLIQTISCKSCSYNSVSLPSVHGLQLGVPSKASPARSKPLQVGKSMRSCT
nr:uncharacterized protein LOC127316646 [Lolium perenne]